MFVSAASLLINHHSARTLTGHGENSEHFEALTCDEIEDVCMLRTSQYQQIKQPAQMKNLGFILASVIH